MCIRDSDKVLSFARWSDTEKLIVISNFNEANTYAFNLKIPEDVIKAWELDQGTYKASDVLYNEFSSDLIINNGEGEVNVKLNPLESLILKIE